MTTILVGLLFLLSCAVYGAPPNVANRHYTVTLPPGMVLWDLCMGANTLVANYNGCFEQGEKYLLIHGQGMQSQCKSMEMINTCLVNISFMCPPVYRAYHQQMSENIPMFQAMCNSNVGFISIEEFVIKFWDFLEMKWQAYQASLKSPTTDAPPQLLWTSTASGLSDSSTIEPNMAYIMEGVTGYMKTLLSTTETTDGEENTFVPVETDGSSVSPIKR